MCKYADPQMQDSRNNSTGKQPDKVTIRDRGMKRHYPLLLLAFLQVSGAFFCIGDLYRRQNKMAGQALALEADDCTYTAVDACDGTFKERSFCFLSFLPNTCEGMPLSL